MVVARYHGQVVFCRDVAGSAARYERCLGFHRDYDSDGDIAMRALVAGDSGASVEIYLHPGMEPAPVHLGTFAVDDVNTAAQELSGDGWQLSDPGPVDQPWGVREATATDPEGHSITLNSPLSSQDPG